MSMVQATNLIAARTTALPSSSQGITMLAWCDELRGSGGTTAGTHLRLSANSDPTATDAFVGSYRSFGTNGLYLVHRRASPSAGYEEATITTQTGLVGIAVISDATNVRSYFKVGRFGALTAGGTVTATSFTPGCFGFNNATSVALGNWGLWPRVLTLAEIEAQFAQRAQRWGGASFYNSGLSSSILVDESGTGDMSLTSGSQASHATDPQVSWRRSGIVVPGQLIPLNLGAGSRSDERHAGIIVAPAPALSGTQTLERDGALLAGLGLAVSGSRTEERFAAAQAALGALLTGTPTEELSGGVVVELEPSWSGSPTNEESGAGTISAGGTPFAVGAGSPSGERPSAVVLSLAPAPTGSGSAEEDGLGTVTLGLPVKGSLSGEESGAGSIAAGVTPFLVGAGNPSAERSGASVVSLVEFLAGSPSNERSGHAQARLALTLAGVRSGEQAAAIVAALAPQGSSVVSLKNGAGGTIGVLLSLPGSPSQEESGTAQIFQVLAFNVGAGSKSTEQSGAGEIDLTVITALAGNVIKIPLENRIIKIPLENRMVAA